MSIEASIDHLEVKVDIIAAVCGNEAKRDLGYGGIGQYTTEVNRFPRGKTGLQRDIQR